MSEVTLFLLGVGGTLAASLVVVLYLRPPLKIILLDLCGTAERANFWAAFSVVTLLLIPLIFALHYQPDPEETLPFVFLLGAQLKWALAGLALAVVVRGMVLSHFIPSGPPSRPAPPAAKAGA